MNKCSEISGEKMNKAKIQVARKLFEENGGIVRMNLLKINRIDSRDIAEMLKMGLISRVRQGYYKWNELDADIPEILVLSKFVSEGVFCLLTAAEYHELSLINPPSFQMAIERSAKRPVIPGTLEVEFFFLPAKQLNIGVIEVEVLGGNVKMFDAEKTVCDCFKFRQRIGMDLALEVLKNYMSRNGKNLQRLMEYAELDRVKEIMRPYVEALVR